MKDNTELLERSVDTLNGLRTINELYPDMKSAVKKIGEDREKAETVLNDIQSIIDEAKELEKGLVDAIRQFKNDVEDAKNDLEKEKKKAIEDIREEKNTLIDIKDELLRNTEEIDRIVSKEGFIEEEWKRIVDSFNSNINMFSSNSANKARINDNAPAIYSIEELHKNRQDYLIVEKDSWTNDYCFYVSEISNGRAYGCYFKAGVYYNSENKGRSISEKKYREYKGANGKRIIDFMTTR